MAGACAQPRARARARAVVPHVLPPGDVTSRNIEGNSDGPGWPGRRENRSGSSATKRIVNSPRGRRVLGQLVRGSTWASYELSRAIRTPSRKPRVSARHTEGALERADTGIGGFGGKISVAALATRAQLQHAQMVPGRRSGSRARSCPSPCPSAALGLPRSFSGSRGHLRRPKRSRRSGGSPGPCPRRVRGRSCSARLGWRRSSRGAAPG